CDKRSNEAPVSPTNSGGSGSLSGGGGSSPQIQPISSVPVRGISPTVRVDVQLPGDLGLSVVNLPLPPVFYVIVGRGPAATIDHTTLLQSDWGKDRTDNSAAGKLPVLHIGFSNPWSAFFSHGMGQPTYLLSLPGFHRGNQPNIVGRGEIKDGGLTSTVFGGCVDRELGWCLDQETVRWEGATTKTDTFTPCGWPVLDGWVAWVQSKSGLEPISEPYGAALEIGGPDIVSAMNLKLAEKYPEYPTGIAPYRLLILRDRGGTMTPEFIYAQYIDFCTGSGRARQDKREYVTARLQPWLDPAKWKAVSKTRKIVVAAEAVRNEFHWEDGKRVCVANGGAIALNAAERARDERCWTDWFHNTDLMEAFGNPRNFTFIRFPSVERGRTPGEGGKLTEAELIAADFRIRLGRAAEVETAVESGIDLNVSLKVGAPRVVPTNPKTPLIRDYKKNGSDLNTGAKYWEASDWYKGLYKTATGVDLPSIKYDRVIFHTGLVLNELGQPYRTGFKDKLYPIVASGGRMVGMETSNAAIRVLGAAVQNGYPDLPAFNAQSPGYAPSDEMWQFRSTLPVSAVPDGFILAGFNIADANHYFDYPKDNRNVNTMTADQIRDALWHAGVSLTDSGDLAKVIVEGRNSANGYENGGDLVAKLLIGPQKKLDAINSVTIEAQLEEGYKKYLAKKKGVEESMTKVPDLDFQRDCRDLLVLLHDNEVQRRAQLLTYGPKDLRGKQEAEAKKFEEFKQKLEENKAAIGKAFDYSY
ncbi:MAG: hypothetical protein ABSG03_39540, partial [Bryobacteraceae bacterium]